jgi:hypothetical protein
MTKGLLCRTAGPGKTNRRLARQSFCNFLNEGSCFKITETKCIQDLHNGEDVFPGLVGHGAVSPASTQDGHQVLKCSEQFVHCNCSACLILPCLKWNRKLLLRPCKEERLNIFIPLLPAITVRPVYVDIHSIVFM